MYGGGTKVWGGVLRFPAVTRRLAVRPYHSGVCEAIAETELAPLAERNPGCTSKKLNSAALTFVVTVKAAELRGQGIRCD
jgi:hypothetical protein